MEDRRIDWLPIDELVRYPRNPKRHDLPALGSSVDTFGFVTELRLNETTGRLLEGHGRLDYLLAQKTAGKEPPEGIREKGGKWLAPVVRGIALTEAQEDRFVVAANRLVELGGWDDKLLADLLSEVADAEGGLIGTGYDADMLGDLLLSVAPPKEQQDPAPQVDRAAELQAEWKTERGQLWQVGAHRVLCGDSTDAADVARLMGGEKAVLCHADPPYGMGKENEGIANDNLYRDKLDALQLAWWKACRPVLADNASVYVWGTAEDLWRLWWKAGLSALERVTLRNEIVWDKGAVEGMGAETHRSYPVGSERCLLFMLGEQGFNNNADNYWEGWEPVRSALAADCKKMGWNAVDIKRICGVGMHQHWFGRSQWEFIPEEHYRKLQAAARDHDAFKREYDKLKREHDELKREHDELKREFYATRAYFDNTHDNMTDVWHFKRVLGEERWEHATPKPVDLVSRCVKSSSPAGAAVIDPFLGSGTTLVACENLGRVGYGCELEPKYVAVSLQRLADMGLTPKLLQ